MGIGRTRAVFLAPSGCGVGPVSDKQTLCQLERPVRPFCGIRLADHRPKSLDWDEILQAFRHGGDRAVTQTGSSG